jgi:limonene-1,2-epoxide hydrolase
MAYEHNWNPDNKLTEKDAIAFLTRVVPDITDNAFHIRKESDDGGTVLSVYIEMNHDGTRGYETKPVKFDELKGWRVVWLTCPPQYTNKWRER